VLRSGVTVRRPVQPRSGAVQALLTHLESVGFAAARRLVADEQRPGRALVVAALAERGVARQVAMVAADGYLVELDERISWTSEHRHLLD
jgi:hypothetical protein